MDILVLSLWPIVGCKMRIVEHGAPGRNGIRISLAICSFAKERFGPTCSRLLLLFVDEVRIASFFKTDLEHGYLGTRRRHTGRNRKGCRAGLSAVEGRHCERDNEK